MKFLQRFLTAGVAVLCLCSIMLSASADTFYNYYGYVYTIYNNTSVSLAGWEGDSPNLVVPDSIEKRNIISIANKAFRNNTELESVDFSASRNLNRIGMYAFAGCTGINQGIKIPSMVGVINDSAFMECTSLPKIDLRSAVATIPDQCFSAVHRFMR